MDDQARVNAAVATMEKMAAPAAAAPAPEKPAEKPEPQPSLAEVIRAQREARAGREAEAKRANDLETQLKTLKSELERAKADRQAFEDDPVGFAKARGWTKEQQLLYGQSLLYDLAPDKADPNFRVKMFEDRQKREEREKTAREEKQRQEAEAAEAREQVRTYATALDAAASSFEPGSYPECEAWFGDDRTSYMQSLMATASNIATRATREGRVADLSPAAVAAVLEAETARRMSARDQRRAATQKPAPAAAPAVAPKPAPDAMQSVETVSTRNMNGGGTPTPPALDEKTRIQRAIQAGFKPR
jgi:hypothetical protein